MGNKLDGLLNCSNCYWGEQCPSCDGVCEYFDAINEVINEMSDQILQCIGRQNFLNAYQEYCNEYLEVM